MAVGFGLVLGQTSGAMKIDINEPHAPGRYGYIESFSCATSDLQDCRDRHPAKFATIQYYHP